MSSIATRDITHIEDVRDADLVPKLLRLLAARTASEYMTATVARAADCDRRTVERYVSLLEMTGLVSRLPAWSANLTVRESRREKLLICNTGLAARLMRKDPGSLAAVTDPARGPLIELFALNEIDKQSLLSDHRANWQRHHPLCWHYCVLPRRPPHRTPPLITMDRPAMTPLGQSLLHRLTDLVDEATDVLESFDYAQALKHTESFLGLHCRLRRAPADPHTLMNDQGWRCAPPPSTSHASPASACTTTKPAGPSPDPPNPADPAQPGRISRTSPQRPNRAPHNPPRPPAPPTGTRRMNALTPAQTPPPLHRSRRRRLAQQSSRGAAAAKIAPVLPELP